MPAASIIVIVTHLFHFLQDKYGSGYVLQVKYLRSFLQCFRHFHLVNFFLIMLFFYTSLKLNLVHSNEQSVASALHYVKSNIHEDAVLVAKQAKTIHINLPRYVDIKKIFSILYSNDSEVHGEYIFECSIIL